MVFSAEALCAVGPAMPSLAQRELKQGLQSVYSVQRVTKIWTGHTHYDPGRFCANLASARSTTAAVTPANWTRPEPASYPRVTISLCHRVYACVYCAIRVRLYLESRFSCESTDKRTKKKEKKV